MHSQRLLGCLRQKRKRTKDWAQQVRHYPRLVQPPIATPPPQLASPIFLPTPDSLAVLIVGDKMQEVAEAAKELYLELELVLELELGY
ncbi:hypothetical protein AWZ03_014169 [Drosophila navojoa]|uniref:Uncharacterized protein n=1 Tax=Drosophila navojoa TaxID=7232 RepID=A0A484AS43_DRONA|nr:hypothetical protein AWZ03_014169 [Drosophila navojoa]